MSGSGSIRTITRRIEMGRAPAGSGSMDSNERTGMLLTLVVAASLFGSVAPCSEMTVSQPERAAAPGIVAQKEAMKKLEWLSGDWEGPAKYDSGRGADAWM